MKPKSQSGKASLTAVFAKLTNSTLHGSCAVSPCWTKHLDRMRDMAKVMIIDGIHICWNGCSHELMPFLKRSSKRGIALDRCLHYCPKRWCILFHRHYVLFSNLLQQGDTTTLDQCFEGIAGTPRSFAVLFF